MNPIEVNQFYNQKKIILNPHREFSFNLNKNTQLIKNVSVNNRFFDISSSGGFQLINHSIKLPENYRDEDIIFYNDTEDCIKKIHDYLSEHSLRKDIAELASINTRSQHTFAQRIEELLKIVSD